MNKKTILQLKAELLETASIVIPPELYSKAEWDVYDVPYIYFRLNKQSRIRLRGSKESSLALRLTKDNTFNLTLKENILLENVEIEPPLGHCPQQIFACFYNQCTVGCRYCPLTSSVKFPDQPKQEIYDMIKNADKKNLDGIGLTSGVPVGKTPDEVTIEMAEFVQLIRKDFGKTIRIGVGPYPCSPDILKKLYDAGTDEIRINLETPNRELFKKACPNKNYDQLVKSISDSVEIFGKNNASSNIVLGLGETDEDIENGIEMLAQMGCIATLKAFNPFYKINEPSVPKDNVFARPSADRLIHLAKIHKKILKKYNLNPKESKTSCMGCGACDLTPFVDF